MKRTSSLAWFALLAVSGACAAADQAPDPQRLREEIAAVDAELFDAFNACDLARMGSMFATDLEFYHDTGGYTGYEETMANTRGNCERKLGLKRTLVADSLEVYPIAGYGAIQKGRHTFCHVESGRDDCGTFGFVHIWKRGDDTWTLARVVSYGH